MTIVEQIINVHPQRPIQAMNELTQCIDAAYDCSQACVSCADACLAEPNVQSLKRCIRLNLDCADICDATGRILSRQTEPDSTILGTQLQALTAACRICAEECERHATAYAHCRVCAEASRRCEQATNRLLSTFSPTIRPATH